MTPKQTQEKPDATSVGEIDEQIDQASERDDPDPIDRLGPPIRNDAEPSAKPPPAATTEPGVDAG
jgi:hypothetical protein